MMNLKFAGNVLNGIKEDDFVVIEPYQGTLKKWVLKRMQYIFKPGNCFAYEPNSSSFSLPFFNGNYRGESFELNMDEKYKCYTLKSVGAAPFKLNGSLVFNAILENGDVVEIGYHKISFYNLNKYLECNDEVVSSAIIESKMPIAIQGETGTGKTALAKKIHEKSNLKGRFVQLNISSFSSNLVESELFGHVKGSFTGASHAKRGALMEANNGTLFLDEIDSLPLNLQIKLLHFLDDYTFRPVGGEGLLRANIRLVSASGSSLIKLVEQSNMRKDFYFRITSGALIELESLRENPAKILKICMEFCNDNSTSMSTDLIRFYENCPWPGNYRQLLSHLEFKKVTSQGKKMILTQDDLRLARDLRAKSDELAKEKEKVIPLKKIKIDYCNEIYHKFDRNLTLSAHALKISRNQLKDVIFKN